MGENTNYQEEWYKFIDSIKKVTESRVHKVRNSYGVYDGFKYYRKNRSKDHKYVLTESQYFSIIRRINELLGESLTFGEDVLLPHRMGRLEVRKYKSNISIKDGKLKTNLPIDWDKTLKLWYEDAKSFKNKTLIRINQKELYRIYYNRNIAEYTNKSFYQFFANRDLKKRLAQNVKEGDVDAFMV